jgi:hypothetical protein
MPYSLLWLSPVLREAGLKVALVDGWESRGRAEMSTIEGVMCHHTAGPARGNMPSLQTLVGGRPDLPGPLSQLGLGRDGTFYVIAAGRCNHAGAGSWNGCTTGNACFIGIEAENTGIGEPWPSVQMDAYARGVAAILNRVRRGPDACAGHKEYALPAGRKDDPTFDMSEFRRTVAGIMQGRIAPPPLIPASEPASATGAPGRPTLRRGATGDAVKTLQGQLGADADGYFGPRTEALVREFQREHGLVPDGIVGPATWKVIGPTP